MKRIISLCMVGIMALTLFGCQSQKDTNLNGEQVATVKDTNKQADETQTSDISIAWIGKTLNNPWWISVADFAEKEAKNLGVDLEISLPEEEVDLEKQVNMIDSAIQKKVDAIIISAASSDGVIPALKKAQEAGIKIVNFDTRIADSSMYDAFVGGDDVYGAYKAGKYICEQLGGQGEVAIITGLMAQSTGVDRHKGFMDACAEYPGIEVVSESGAEWRSDLAASVTENILTAHPNVKAIFASNDQMAQGMVSAVKASGKSEDDLILVGYDGILDAAKLVVNGELDAFVALPNIDEGVMGVRLATALVLNPDYTYERELIYPTPLVTKEFVEGYTDYTIYEYMAERFPLNGKTEKGY